MLLKKNTLKRKKKTSSKKRFPSTVDYFLEILLQDEDDIFIKHPTNEIWLRNQVLSLCRKPLSTQTVPLLVALSGKTEDGLLRGLLEKKIHLLRTGSLESYKEFSDRALILLTDRETFFEKWEGFYIMGCFGRNASVKFLTGRLEIEFNPLLRQTIKRAIEKIKTRKEKKKLERGF